MLLLVQHLHAKEEIAIICTIKPLEHNVCDYYILFGRKNNNTIIIRSKKAYTLLLHNQGKCSG